MPRRITTVSVAIRTRCATVLLLYGAACATSLPAVPVLAGEGAFAVPKRTGFRGWQAYVLENEWVRLHVVPEVGGRVMQFSLDGKEFFWVNPRLAGAKPPESGLGPDGEWLNYGGDKLWPAPQGWDNDQQWPGPPDAVLDGLPYRAEPGIAPPGIRLTSGHDPRCGIRFSRTIRLDPHSTRVSIEATMTNIDTVPRRWGVWSHTQLDAGLPGRDGYNRHMRAWCPINPQSHFERGYDVIFGERDNPSFRGDETRGLMNVSYHYRVGKIGLDSHAGWVATVDGQAGDVFVQRFTFEPKKEYPDGSSVEFWHNGQGRIHAYNTWIDMPDDPAENPYVFESEILSPFARLEPGDCYRWGYDWYACRIGGDFPILDCSRIGVTCEEFRLVKEQRSIRASGRFGVFHQGQVTLVLHNRTGSPIAASKAVPVSPVLPLVVSEWRLPDAFAVPQESITAILQLRNPSGQILGVLATCKLP
jgi:hypothetical protein